MPSATAKYAFPYPLGTDRVADGDNAIQSLAERVEAVLGFTGKAFMAVKGGTASSIVGDSNFYDIITVTCTGVPVGGLVVAVASMNAAHASANGYVLARVASAHGNALILPDGSGPQGKAQSAVANAYVNVVGWNAFTITTANPVIRAQVSSNSGTVWNDPNGHLFAFAIA